MTLKIREAFPYEIDIGFCLLREAAIWLKNNAIDYWQEWLSPPIEYIEWIKQGFNNNEFYFVENENSELVSMFRLQFEDEIFWGKRNDKSGYIHSLTTIRSLKGNQIGYSILHMIEQFLIEKDIHLLRLDCPPDLARLCRYYEDFGFVPQGMATVMNTQYQLYEKKIPSKNPWIEIPYSDYENHMTEVGQAQVLSILTKYCLDKYLPENFALLGCATGNGLEHIKCEFTKRIYTIDINRNYLDRTNENFANKINQIETIHADIQTDELKINDIDLFFVGLVLEYVEPKTTLKKIIDMLSNKGVLFIVIQKNRQTSFVTKTRYKSLEKLADISNEVNENEIDAFIRSENLVLVKREEIYLTRNKSFITLEYRVERIKYETLDLTNK